ncbi:polar amino acid transport system substrate-binding protein [Pelomonas aquatica]|uniref:Polar amino acid transport system substrate-binding protein n=1 Tax=Pelomonas aquatica TaxID=431058 RepID=A0ABU1Z4I9_9BURK|nr:transporter substrate-binding domain-containing protein [Pelomonas aquatica]MDR7295514.1 polar amino acid transport system substrate-binding protein [Pelomonas aquatica]
MAAGATQAGCSRIIEAPMAPVGLSVSFDGERSSGIYPTLLNELGAAIGCEFRIQRMPRARVQKMFESGQADVLVPASASPGRDADGEFVPLVQVRASLITLSPGKAPRSLAELLALRHYKLAVVRGFTFGTAYDQAIATLRAQRRLVEEPDAAGVARALRQGLAQASVMTANIFIGTLTKDADFAPLIKHVRIEALEELGWSESGLYLSRHSLTDTDRRALRTALTQSARSGRVWQLFNDSYPPGSLAGSIRPLLP